MNLTAGNVQYLYADARGAPMGVRWADSREAYRTSRDAQDILCRSALDTCITVCSPRPGDQTRAEAD